MNILLINHYAGSVRHGMEFRPYYMAREWSRMGHRVRITAASYSHVRSRQPALQPGPGPTRELIDGIEYYWYPGAEMVCDAIIQHGTDAQKERFVKPLLRGERFAAECLTEPRGGSDFFGATTKAEDRGDHFLLNGQRRFIVGAEGADFFLVYARTNAAAKPQDALSCLIVERGPGVETKYLYGLMGCRGGGTGRLVFKNVRVEGKRGGEGPRGL